MFAVCWCLLCVVRCLLLDVLKCVVRGCLPFVVVYGSLFVVCCCAARCSLLFVASGLLLADCCLLCVVVNCLVCVV